MNSSFITIVSGLPRSGTSMMMQALEAGGIPALTDNLRIKDDDNPKGYYEFEPVKKTKQNPSWIPSAAGKAVKMIYSLLYDLPDTFEYRVVFMNRNLREVIDSQKKMLAGKGNLGAGLSDEKMLELFQAQLAKFHHWVGNQKHFSILMVNYHDMVTSPKDQVVRINAFLGGNLDAAAMAAAVDPSLYRHRAPRCPAQ